MDRLAVACACLTLLAAQLFAKWYYNPLRHVPTAGGPSIPLLSYLAAYRFARHPENVLQEGYDKFHGSTFKVALPHRWMVVVSGPDGVEDMRRRADHDLSIKDGFNEILQTEHIMGRDVNEDRWHVDVIKSSLTSNLPSIFPELLDELPLAVQDNLICEDGWTVVNVFPAVLNIVARLSSRIFVGLPLCRSLPYIRLAIRFTAARLKDASTMKLIPPVLRPMAARFLDSTRVALLEANSYIEPMIRERRADMERFGNDWQDRPNDLLQWFMDEASMRDTSDEAVPPRLFLINFASIHTSSMSMVNALHHLAAYPEYTAPLRAEVEQVITSDGWTKTAIDKMWKVDSFLRESQRSRTVARFALNRVAMRDLTLVDGTFIPQGTLIATAPSPAHRDQKYYHNADVFDAFRFSSIREETGVSAAQAFTHTSAKWLAFGHGKHACPGRFFAADELKALLAYIVLNYDIKADDPPNGAQGVVTDTLLVRKRKTDLQSFGFRSSPDDPSL